jgi:hypothetical protein
MADKPFADAIVDRYKSGGGKADKPSAKPESEGDDDEGYDPDDAEMGRTLAAAIKRGDGAAICEAVRAIKG